MRSLLSAATQAFALLSLLGSDVSGVLAAPSAGCGKTPTITSGQARTMTVNGKQRQYIVRLPERYDNSQPHRLVFTFHALGGNMNQIATGNEAYYGLPPLANSSAIFVSPNGQTAGSAFGLMGWGNVGGEDIMFVDAMLAAIEADLCVDTNLRFSTGFSYGAGMSYAIACARSEQFRAVALMSAGIISGCQGGTKPIAYYHQHGTRDQVLPITGGRQMRNTFVRNNGCQPQTSEPQPPSGGLTRVDYTGCDPKYPTTWVVFDGDHTPSPRLSSQSGNFSPRYVWGFFSQFT
ncbi:hypothetical protein MAPG_09167 [Magnaporthiopsis poae ATCC 64411]|uniref:feruloyl esterase n=1 Tax=Magnaporthiopsis poae (strain ATCC 64411 / 73-15) TaxID=644358 RepID=A0A0C4E988_MAGP6|nr:hypothetical protein MAPG_09167 [Magnaporthiopsis poae ATCC 64411]